MFCYKCNIWDFVGVVDAICVTTNGFVASNGHAVMGRGIALEASQRYPSVKKTLGKILAQYGNHVSIIWTDNHTNIVSFPVKRDKFDMEKEEGCPGVVRNMLHGNVIPGWALKAEIEIIKRSAHELMEMIERSKFKSVLLTQPGCNNGELYWPDVEKELELILDHRVFIVKKGD